jgi:hypothetical protein
MKHVRLFVFLVFAGGLGGLLGSVVGNAFGKRALFIGGFVGGAFLTWIAARLAGRWGWIPRPQLTGVSIGATLGFLVAATIAINTLSSPIGPVLSTLAVGLGGFLGGRFGGRAPLESG